MSLTDEQRAAARRQLVVSLHDETHAKPGKLTHPNCPYCQDDFSPERIAEDAAMRRQLGLL